MQRPLVLKCVPPPNPALLPHTWKYELPRHMVKAVKPQ